MARQFGCVSPWAAVGGKFDICKNITAAEQVYLMEKMYNAGFDGGKNVILLSFL
jgi:hypothetical protein